MITASHNPPKYNGYKAYWDDGSQIVAPIDLEIIKEVKNITDYTKIKTITKEEAIEKGLLNIIGQDMDEKYLNVLKSLVINKEIMKKEGKDIKVVFTPLHGTGSTVTDKLLEDLGIQNLYVVPEQREPDGNFPTVDYPNPEEKKAFKLALELARKVDADIVLATDPDADRLGVFSKDSKSGEYMEYTGNMSALIIAEYRLSQLKERGLIPDNGMLIKTVVSSDLADAVAKEYDLECIEVLTGFKNIGAVIKKAEQNNNDKTYMFGFEESYGCLIGDYARDKDGVSAIMALCEATCYYKSQGKTLWDAMNDIYEKYGYYKETQVSIVREGIEGAAEIKLMMDKMRSSDIKNIGEYVVEKYKDIENDYMKDMLTGEVGKTNLPKSNVLYYGLNDNSWCAIRPSGTEPKIKIYMGIKGKTNQDAIEKLEKLKNDMLEIVQ